MTSVQVPYEAASHLGAILLAFNRQIFSSFLDEADELAELGQTGPAVLIAGTVLEYFEKSPAAVAISPAQSGQIAQWRLLRSQVAHGTAGALTAPHARQMIDGVRNILRSASTGEKDYLSSARQAGDPGKVKGKYSQVPTSSYDFIERKREEREREGRG